MKFFMFHLMPYRALPPDFEEHHDSAWVWIPNELYDPETGAGYYAEYLDQLAYAEELGFDGVFAFDHFFPPGAAPDRPSLEAFTTLGAVAAATSRVRLGTLVTRTVLRPPGMLAKMASTVDLISGGRMILAVGTGDPIDRPEHEAFGFPDLSVPDRRANLVETVTVLKALFEGRAYEGGDRHPRIEGPLLPPPAQAGGPPIWIGAQADPVVRMAGQLADGWNGWALHPDTFHRKVDVLDDAAAQSGRSVEATWAGIVLVGEDEAEAERLHEARLAKNMDALAWVGPVDRFAEFLRTLQEAGASWAIFVLAGPPGRRELIAERVLPAFGG
jgi:alkanesulfonate monooxygenase SsuD/methylene tetrahydromethanopterin reductase-like flavin-dependent oxidoreductase (luciferase family)